MTRLMGQHVKRVGEDEFDEFTEDQDDEDVDDIDDIDDEPTF